LKIHFSLLAVKQCPNDAETYNSSDEAWETYKKAYDITIESPSPEIEIVWDEFVRIYNPLNVIQKTFLLPSS
jgi:hypothetical protein